jgi:BioD-like phosphotransacetylase family protein
MALLFMGSTGDRAGHTLITWAIARRLVEKGLKVGFVKPFGTQPVRVEGVWTDHDTHLFRAVLKIDEPSERICPYLITDDSWRGKGNEEILDEFKSLVQELSQGKDILIVMGSKHIFFDDAACPIPDISFVPELGADFVLVHRYRTISKSNYSILSVSSLLKEQVKGIILNRVPLTEIENVRREVVSNLSQKGLSITAALPEDPALSFRSLHEVQESLQAEPIGAETVAAQPVAGLTVGSVDLTGELNLFKRAYNKIVLLKPSGPDRETEEPAAPRPVAAIVLTGGRSPAPQLLEAARKARVPLLVVKEDTFATLERLEQTTSWLSPHDDAKVLHLMHLMDRDGALDRLMESIGLHKTHRA